MPEGICCVWVPVYVGEKLRLNLYINTAVAAGLGCSLGHENRAQAVNSANRNRLVVDCINKRDNLIDKRLIVMLEETLVILRSASHSRAPLYPALDLPQPTTPIFKMSISNLSFYMR